MTQVTRLFDSNGVRPASSADNEFLNPAVFAVDQDVGTFAGFAFDEIRQHDCLTQGFRHASAFAFGDPQQRLVRMRREVNVDALRVRWRFRAVVRSSAARRPSADRRWDAVRRPGAGRFSAVRRLGAVRRFMAVRALALHDGTMIGRLHYPDEPLRMKRTSIAATDMIRPRGHPRGALSSATRRDHSAFSGFCEAFGRTFLTHRM